MNQISFCEQASLVALVVVKVEVTCSSGYMRSLSLVRVLYAKATTSLPISPNYKNYKIEYQILYYSNEVDYS